MNKMFNFNGMPYKRSGRVGGKSVSMVGMLVLLLAALLVLPSCTGTDTRTVCGEGHELNDDGECVATNPPPTCEDGELLNQATGMCEARPTPPPMCDEGQLVDPSTNMCVDPVDPVTCGTGTVLSDDGSMCIEDPDAAYYTLSEGEGDCSMGGYDDGDDPGMVRGYADADECINGEGGNDVIKAMGGDDTVTGGAGDDMLYGGPGDDTIDGQAGDDTIDGGADDDMLTGGSGDNTLEGGDGDDDTASYTGALRATVQLDRNRARAQHDVAEMGGDYLSFGTTDSGTGDDRLMGIENVKGSPGADHIDGDDNDNRLEGYDGADRINGKGGNDMIIPNRPAKANAMGVLEADAADETASPTPEDDGADMVNGGAGTDTISYEGESEVVTVTLNTATAAAGVDDVGFVAAVTDDATTTDTDESVAAYLRVVVTGVATDHDRIAVVPNEATEDEDDLVSTIENITGGFGADVLTGDARANTLRGGAGGDTLTGGGGDDTLYGGADVDTLVGGDGDDTYMEVKAIASGANAETDTVTEVAAATSAKAGMMDTVHYATLKDDASTAGEDESVVTATVPDNVEVAVGTPNIDNLTANGTGTIILGRGGNDNLDGAAGEDTLVGCAGKNALNGGDGDDVFGVLMGSTNDIEDFTTGSGTTVTDEIHLKGFAAGAAFTLAKIADNVTHAAVQVGGVTVARVTSTAIVAIADNPDTTEVETSWKSQVDAIIDALRKNGAVSFDHTFDTAKCM